MVQDGVVSFDFNSQHFNIPGMELLIFVDVPANRENIVDIPNGQSGDFHFSITSTLKNTNLLANKDKDWLAKNWYNASMSWDESRLERLIK